MSTKENRPSVNTPIMTSPRKTFQNYYTTSYNDSVELKQKLESQSKALKKRKKLYDSYKSRNTQIWYVYNKLREELVKLYPERLTKLKEFEQKTQSESESGEFDPEFIPVEKAFCKEIQELKDEAKILREYIGQLLILLTEQDDEEFANDGDELSDIDERISINPPTPNLKSNNDIFFQHELASEKKNSCPFEVAIDKPSELTSSPIEISFKEIPINPIIEESKNWEPLPYSDDYRASNAYTSGGFALLDQQTVTKLRSVGKEIIREMGKKILSGNLNLTQISFPIRCMQGNTALHNTLKTALMNPLYLTKAAYINDPVERMKLVIVSSISSFIHTSTFEKPLNPVLGETLHGYLEDGSELYAEQSSHHPPVSHFLIKGPSDSYQVSGYFNFIAKARINSVTITNVGRKVFSFPDGQSISQNCPEEVFSGTFFGTMRHESLGVVEFNDEGNGYKCKLQFGGNKNMPSDYIFGSIIDSNGNSISTIKGTYCGYIDFDGRRYWDARHIRPYEVKFSQILPSDSEVREDIILLRQGNIDAAQQAKENIENVQRHDRKLREVHHKH
ncbi:KES1_7 [Blepharisma stoltei]|uniref:Oxysterol-binding protein n=1 Tax=Blepharisma stoltei TaxID=1481888 RepID=A0AAU9JKY4_9CILI|nr:unnamed protein product [Blepharisma stoltei]